MKTFALCFTLLCAIGAISAAVVPGGATRITDKEQLQELTQKVKHYLVEFNKKGFGTQLELLHTRSATVQVVAGVLYVLKADLLENKQETECKIDLWEKSWENFAKLDIECGNGKSKYSFVTVHKEVHGEVQSEEMAGGVKKITDPTQLNKLTQKVKHYLVEFSKQGLNIHLELLRTRSATVQVVAGVRYVLMADLLEDKQETVCKVELWEKSWENFAKLDIECGNGKSKYSFVHHESHNEEMAGGVRKITDPAELEKLGQKVNSYLVELSNQGSNIALKFLRTRSATVQVVAGVRYVLMADLLEDEQETVCKVELWEKSWENFAKLDIECNNGQSKYSFVTKHQEINNDN